MEALLQALLDNAHDPTWIVARDGTLMRGNRPFARLFADIRGASAEPGVELSGFLGDVERDVVRRTLERRSVSAEARVMVHGASRVFALSGTPVVDNGAVTAAVISAREVTHAPRGAREDLFELSLTRLFIAGESPLGETLGAAVEYLCESDAWDAGVIWLLGDDSNVLAAVAVHAAPELAHGDELHDQLRNIRFARGHGLPGRAWASDDVVWIADIAEESNVTRAHLADRLGLHAAVAVPLRVAARVVGVLELFTRDVRPVDELRARALLRTGGGLGRLIERRRTEDERRRLLQVIERKGLEWSLTFDAIELPIFITSMDGVVRRMNRAGRDLAGGDYTDVIGLRLRAVGMIDTQPKEPWTTLAACVEAVRDSGETCAAQAYDPETDRSWDVAANSYQPDGDPPRAILIARETTNVVRLQNAVRRGEQLSALGELVAGVAHQVRNPLFGMQITVDSLEETLPKNEETTEMLVLLRRWLERLNRLMESLLAYGRTWSIDLQPGSVEEVLQQSIEAVLPVANANDVRVDVRIAPTRTMLMDPSRLIHAFENLLTNAIQHSQPGASVVLTAEEVDEAIEVAVRDRGPGFAVDDMRKVFEPFFTRRRGGTGLGLSIVQRIVDEHGGTVRAGNADGGGAIVTVRFPVYEVQAK